MTDTATKANASAESEEEATEEITLENVRQKRIQSMGIPRETESEKEEETTEAEEEEEESSTTESEETSEESEESNEDEESEEDEEGDKDDVLSQIDWASLDEDTKIAIAKEVGSGAAKRIGELTGKVKNLESELKSKGDALDQKLSLVSSDNNAFSSITDEQKLAEIEKTANDEIRFYRDWLRKNDKSDAYVVGDKEYSYEDVWDYVEYRDSQLKDIPKQRENLKNRKKVEKKAKELEEKIGSDFDWYHDEKSKQRSVYDELVSSPDMTVISRVAPDIAAQLRYNLAHAAQSMAGEVKKKITLSRKKGAPPARESGARGSSPNAAHKAEVKKLTELSKNGDIQATRKLRLLKLQNKF